MEIFDVKHYEEIDQEAIKERDIKYITKYRMKKSKEHQKQTNICGILMLIPTIIVCIYLLVTNGGQKYGFDPFVLTFMILIIIIFTVFTIIDTKTTNKIKAEVKKQYGVK